VRELGGSSLQKELEEGRLGESVCGVKGRERLS
jgi:hypothetical protein